MILHVETVEFTRVLRIDRPEKLGALSTELITALGEQFALLARDRAIRSVVLTGTGRGFIAGADIEEYATASREEFVEYTQFSRRVFESLADLPQVTIAAVNGYAFGGGFELALCCDVILAAESAKFGLPEVKLGLVPGGGGLLRLADAAGTRWAKEVILSGRTVSSSEAHGRGILTEVVPDAQLFERAMARAHQFAQRAPLAVREVKSLMARPRPATAEVDALERLFDSADATEGINAFIDKRGATFRGE